MSVPLIQQIACIEREIKMRRRAYPRWIETQKMTQSLADREIAAMEAVLATLQSLPVAPQPNKMFSIYQYGHITRREPDDP